MRKKINIMEDTDGKKTVVIHDIKFKGKRTVNWNEVEEYLRQYIGEFYKIQSVNDIIYIGTDFPDEYTHSNYTKILKGANAKAKANVTQGLPELIENADNEKYIKNRKEKHMKDAKYGWYIFESRFALPVFTENGDIERYNVFHAALLVRHSKDGRKYLYDIMKIKKETSILFEHKNFTQ